MDPYCRGCAYRQKFEGGGTICGYAVITDHLRGCPAGKDCIRYSKTLRSTETEKGRWNRALKKSFDVKVEPPHGCYEKCRS